MSNYAIDYSTHAENAEFEHELAQLQAELVKLQDWISTEKRKVVVLFEGGNVVGKDVVVNCLTDQMNQKICRVAALQEASDHEKTQWYFKRFVDQLPEEGELVLFSRSWYERVSRQDTATYQSDQHEEFLRAVPEFEDLLLGSGITVIKYWFSSIAETEAPRFPMDLESRNRLIDRTRATEQLFKYTSTDATPWHRINPDVEAKAGLNCIRHLLSQFDYVDDSPDFLELAYPVAAAGDFWSVVDAEGFEPYAALE